MLGLRARCASPSNTSGLRLEIYGRMVEGTCAFASGKAGGALRSAAEAVGILLASSVHEVLHIGVRANGVVVAEWGAVDTPDQAPPCS
jgi:hypothetical protein